MTYCRERDERLRWRYGIGRRADEDDTRYHKFVGRCHRRASLLAGREARSDTGPYLL